MEEERREARVARDLADPRWKRIRVRNPLVGKWWSGVVIGGARGEAATRGLGGSANLVLYEDGEERVEDLDEVEWEERGSVPVKVWSSGRVKTSGRSSRYRGVGWHKSKNKWQVQIPVDGRTVYLGRFVDEIVAARAYDAFVITKKLTKPVNFPDDPAAKGHVATSSKKKSHFRGVSWRKREKKWEVKIWVDGKTKWIASFVDENVAARAYDAYAITNGIHTQRNFPDEDEDDVVAEVARFRAAPKKRKNAASKSSRFRCVSWIKREKKWRVHVCDGGKRRSLGSFKDEEQAGRAVDKYVVDNNLDRPLNFPVAAEEEDRESSLEDDTVESSSVGGGLSTARGGKRKRSRAEEERRATRMTSDLADPRRKKIRVRRASSGRSG